MISRVADRFDVLERIGSGGMGDVLSGIIAALLMQFSANNLQERYEAARLAVYIHGLSADIIAKSNGKIGMLASDLFPVLQHIINNKL